MGCNCQYGASFPIPVTQSVGGIQRPKAGPKAGITTPSEGYIEQRQAYGAIPIPTTTSVGGLIVPTTSMSGGIQVPKEGYITQRQNYGTGLGFLQTQVPLPIVGALSVGSIAIGILVVFLVVKYIKKKKE